MADEKVLNVQKEQTVTGKTVLSFTKPTPMWENWVFRITFILTGLAIFVIAGDPAIDDATKVRIGVYLKALDTLIWTMSKSLGVEISRNFDTPA